MRLLIVLSVLALATCGCGAKKVEVQSDGCYDGHVGGRAIDACGNQTYALKGDPKCGTFTLKDNGTYLRARIKGRSWVETTVHFDSVTVCE